MRLLLQVRSNRRANGSPQIVVIDLCLEISTNQHGATSIVMCVEHRQRAEHALMTGRSLSTIGDVSVRIVRRSIQTPRTERRTTLALHCKTGVEIDKYSTTTGTTTHIHSLLQQQNKCIFTANIIILL
jgi:hypothetical protein